MIGDGAGLLVSRGVTAAGLPALAAPEAFAATLARFLALYRDCLVEQTRAYPDVPDVLPELAEAGHRLGVCTNKPIEPTRRILAALDLARFFGAVLGGDSLPQRKPAPEPLLATIAALGDSAAGGGEVMIGDSANDMLCARAASVTGILIPSDYGNPAEDADLTLARFADLPAALARL
jgi:phosphoglycolate phosphatase